MAEARDCVPGTAGCPTKPAPPAARPKARAQPPGPQPLGQRPPPQGQAPRTYAPPRPEAPQGAGGGQTPQGAPTPPTGQGAFNGQRPHPAPSAAQHPAAQAPAPSAALPGQSPPLLPAPQAPRPQGAPITGQPLPGQPLAAQSPQPVAPQGDRGRPRPEAARGPVPQAVPSPGPGGTARPLPLAVQQGALRIERPPVPRYSQNRFARSGGLTDLEAFGLGALAAVTLGALLSNGNRVVSTRGDRVVYVTPQGDYGVYHDDDAILRRPGASVWSEGAPDGRVLTRIVEPDGTVIETLRTANGRVLRRTVTDPDGRRVVLFDDTAAAPPVPDIAQLPSQSPVDVVYGWQTTPDLLQAAFLAPPLSPPGRIFSLAQVRDIPQVRYLVPEVEVSTLDFAPGSSAVSAEQVQGLATVARVMNDLIARNPAEVFLIEGHTDSTGDPAQNLALSDARAEATAMALSDAYGVPPQNLVTQGYGETDLRNPTYGADPVNRHTILRRITPLLPPVGP